MHKDNKTRINNYYLDIKQIFSLIQFKFEYYVKIEIEINGDYVWDLGIWCILVINLYVVDLKIIVPS